MTGEALAARRCVPCRRGTPPLGEAAVAALLPEVPAWTLEEGRRLRREFRFPDFARALGFVDRVGALAEAEGHHPDLHLGWGRVGVVLWTHAAGGLTEADFILAAKIDRLDAPAA
ncbi:MAG: 4a-hydroxytetrahydrobiopterin dehydratase [Planctomycetes bacterium]|nr:4a-hydroxytetrahydrobiopterin dehydratase [Planctomycetota bacterium]